MTPPLEAVREALEGREAWLVGGAVRDRLLGRETDDVDVSLEGDPRAAARRIARATGGAHFRLSGAFGAWRVVGRDDERWHVDLVPLRDGDIRADLAARDFTVNAMAEPLAGGETLDPHGGRADLEARRLRMVSAEALADDPLRCLRAVRLAVELELELEEGTREAVLANSAGIERVAPERVFGELKRVVGAPRPTLGIGLMNGLGLLDEVLPELAALRGVEQNVFHHTDVYGHTLEVLDAVAAIERDPAAAGLDPRVGELLAEPFADELTRGQAMRFAALLHDAAKPQTRGELPDGRVTFLGHDAAGAELARAVLARLRASERLRDYVAALTRHHLALGFLVHEGPLSRRAAWRYLRATAPYAIDVTVLTVADRLATRGKNAGPAIAAHVELATAMLELAFAEREAGPRPPIVRGDDLARELGMRPGPELGELLARLEEDRYAGEIATREQALARAREIVEG
jgi:putative nucleotidyltransferase with HDIG domain